MAKSADAFRTISEVAEWLETPAHVLRFWESKFAPVKPVKRAGGRRYYRPADMRLLGGIKRLLHEEGMSIKSVQKLLREEGVKHVAALSQPIPGEESAAPVIDIRRDRQGADRQGADETPARPSAEVVDFSEDGAGAKWPEPEPGPETEPASETEPAPESVAAEAVPTPAPGPQEAESAIAEAPADIMEEDAPRATPDVPDHPAAITAPVAEAEAAPDAAAGEAANDRAAPDTAGDTQGPATDTTDTTEPPAPPAPAIPAVEVAPDPDDALTAPPGVLSALAALPRPLRPRQRQALRPFLSRLQALNNADERG